ncbi:MAG: hypothetical protein ACYTG6_06850 [Planctomycetota bacterium]|jgi:hypothetical protein
MGGGFLAGAVAALSGAILWATITVLTGWQIGWMAIGIGALVGVAVRAGGNGQDPAYGFMGAALALVGCMLGNLLAVCGIVADMFEVSFFTVFTEIGLAAPVEILTETFEPMDLLFYGLAVYSGYQLSFHKPAD